MKLADWLTVNSVSDDDFAARIETSRQTVWRYKRDRIPKPDVMTRITRATGGQVQPSDFYQLEAQP
jgi:hypothetical protein